MAKQTLERRLERRVLIVDDSRTIQALLDNAFSQRADFRVVGFCGDASMAVEMVNRLMPDIVTIDLCMPYLDGAALLEMLSDLKSICKIVVSDQPSKNLLLASKLVEAGAAACLSKTELASDPAGFFSKVNAAVNTVITSRPHYLGKVCSQKSELDDGGPDVFSRSGSTFPVPQDESHRLRILRAKGLCNATPERQFDLVTKHVAKITAFPVCLITFIDRDTQWIKSSSGLEVETTPRDQAFCNYTIAQGSPFVVANAATDGRFANNPLVIGAPVIRSYAGHPIRTSDGVAVGALCVIDIRVRTVSKHVLDQLAGMSEIVAEMIDQRPAIAA